MDKTVKPGRKKGTPKTGGRKAGTPNKNTTLLKDAILLAAEAEGEDGKGKSGLTGYLRMLARDERRAFATLMGRVLPTQVEGDLGVTVVRKTVYEKKPDDR